MLASFKVKGFKGIKQGEVDNLAQVNIITGKNNMGKSAFLQSMYLFNSDADGILIPGFKKSEMHWLFNAECRT